jgi:hypothetical protein
MKPCNCKIALVKLCDWGKNSGLIEGYLMSIQEFIIKNTVAICILTSFHLFKK